MEELPAQNNASRHFTPEAVARWFELSVEIHKMQLEKKDIELSFSEKERTILRNRYQYVLNQRNKRELKGEAPRGKKSDLHEMVKSIVKIEK